MAHVTIDALSHGRNLGFVTDRIKAVRTALRQHARRRPQFRTIEAELRRYSRNEITELGISRADISHIANEATQYRREEEFQSALDNYIADYKKHRAASEVGATA